MGSRPSNTRRCRSLAAEHFCVKRGMKFEKRIGALQDESHPKTGVLLHDVKTSRRVAETSLKEKKQKQNNNKHYFWWRGNSAAPQAFAVTTGNDISPLTNGGHSAVISHLAAVCVETLSNKRRLWAAVNVATPAASPLQIFPHTPTGRMEAWSAWELKREIS